MTGKDEPELSFDEVRILIENNDIRYDTPEYRSYMWYVTRARNICARLSCAAMDETVPLLEELFGRKLNADQYVCPPFRCDLGYNIEFEGDVFINYDAVFIDSGKIRIGDGARFGPRVTIITADHSRSDPESRRRYDTFPKPVTIGRDTWIGAGAYIMPGITVGDGAIVGAGAVVTKDVPPGTTVVGIPARPLERGGR